MILLDTCALIFDALAPQRLSARARRTIDNAAAEARLALSDISLWETAMLVAHGRLDPGTDCGAFLRLALATRGIRTLPISIEIAQRAADLNLHGDPADRIIAATAIAHEARLVTADKRLRRSSSVPSLW